MKYLTLAAVALTAFCTAASATITVNWVVEADAFSFGTGEQLYDFNGAAAARDGSWTFAAYAHSGGSAAVASHANFSALAGSVMLGSSSGWMVDGLNGANAGTVAGSHTITDAPGTSPQIGWNVYLRFENAAGTHAGYIWDSSWTIPDDTGGPASVSPSGGRTAGSPPDGGSVLASADPGDGWAAIHAVPEPGTFALFALGLGAIAARRKMNA